MSQPIVEAINETRREMAHSLTALLSLLDDKGIVNLSEFAARKEQLTAAVDQEWASMEETANKEAWEALSSGEKMFAKLMGVEEP